MKYEKPEMEIMEFKQSEVFTVETSGSEGGQGPGSGTGDDPWA